LTQNLPNLLIKTSSPDASVDLMISRIISTVSRDFFVVNPFFSAMASIIWDFVRVMEAASLQSRPLKAIFPIFVASPPEADQSASGGLPCIFIVLE
jgi:hypothetical protein